MNQYDFVSAVNAIAARNPTYRTGGIGKDGTCDCIGATMGAMYALGKPKYPLHSSNYFARYQTVDLQKIKNENDCYVGMQVYKSRPDTGQLNARYAAGGTHHAGDSLDYYHAGVVISVSPFVILHCTSGGGLSGFRRDTNLKGGWDFGGKVKGVDYSEDQKGGLVILAAIYDAQVVTTGGHLNFRSAPRTGGTDIGDIPNGTLLQVLEETNADWSKVFWGGREGYVQSGYLSRIEGNTSSGADTEANGDVETVTIALPRSVALAVLDAFNKGVGR